MMMGILWGMEAYRDDGYVLGGAGFGCGFGFGFGFCGDRLTVDWIWVMCKRFGISRVMGCIRGVGVTGTEYLLRKIDT